MINVGISSCLLGNAVRFDGGHRRSALCNDVFSKHFNFIPICPEMAIGLPTPRPTLRLQTQGEKIIVKAKDGQEVTEALTSFSESKAAELFHLSGYILCSKSPSCGMERVRLYTGDTKNCTKDGVGVFAQALMKKQPNLPLEEDGRLSDPILRDNFVTRVFAYQEWLKLNTTGLTAKALLRFHQEHKYLLMAHNQSAYRELGNMLADLSQDIKAIAETYISKFMSTLKKPASRKNHSNVLLHMAGYFKRDIDSPQRLELRETIDNYRVGKLPLLAPIVLLKHYQKLYPKPYLSSQAYLTPHPEQMALRVQL